METAHIKAGTLDTPQRPAGGDIKVMRHCLDGASLAYRGPFTIEVKCASQNRADALRQALERLQQDGPDR
jgi:hypothetical protein